MSTCKSCKSTCYCLLANSVTTRVEGTGDMTNPYQVNVPVSGFNWTYPCPKSTGGAIYLNDSGQPVTAPEHTITIGFGSGTDTLTPSQTAGVTTTETNPLVSLTYTNPSACRDMNLMIIDTITFTASTNVAGTASYSLRLTHQINGGGYVLLDSHLTTLYGTGTGAYLHSVTCHRPNFMTLAASGAVTVDIKASSTWFAGASAAMAYTLAGEIRIVGMTK